ATTSKRRRRSQERTAGRIGAVVPSRQSPFRGKAGGHRILGSMVVSRSGGGWSGRRRTLGALALGLYALLIAISPAMHHDLACHVKSPAHCDACMANSPASRAEPRTGLEAPALVATSDLPAVEQAREHGTSLRPTSGRAPPA